MKRFLLTAVLFAAGSMLFANEAAYDVIERFIGDDVKRFELIEQKADSPFFQLNAENGKVTVTGDSGVSLCRGAYHYLRENCGVMRGWDGTYPVRVAEFPDQEEMRVEARNNFFLYYNVCVYGYTSPFWHWDSWESEIDWMALHGINMPVVMTGQEYVWQKVWNSLGISNEDLKDHFTGPAYLPWNRMGNISGYDGPLPQSFIDGKMKLNKKIIDRMKALGMDPVVPAFSGFVPAELKKLYPQELVETLKGWVGFPKDETRYLMDFLDPESGLFADVQKKFITEYNNLYGDMKYYLSDPFNEVEVPGPRDLIGKSKALKKYGRYIYDSIAEADSDAVWVMQGWMFFFDKHYWSRSAVRSFLKNVPDERMIVLDLGNELFHGWRNHSRFYGKKWIYSVIPTFGGNNPLSGDLEFYSRDYLKAAGSCLRGNMVGGGLSPEGVENNDVIYELFADRFWATGPEKTADWIENYCDKRYGGCPDNMKKAWEFFQKSFYGQSNWGVKHGYMQRPSLDVKSSSPSPQLLLEGCRLFFSCYDELVESQLYHSDLVEVSSRYVSCLVDMKLKEAVEAHKVGDKAKRDNALVLVKTYLEKIDSLCTTVPHLTFQKWCNDAVAWAADETERDYYLQDAKRQITKWGESTLFDYAAKSWSGLLGSYYAPRWIHYFKYLDNPEIEADMDSWEEQWITDGVIPQSTVPEDVSALFKEVFDLRPGAVFEGSAQQSKDFLY